jgi:hypothetical protein
MLIVTFIIRQGTRDPFYKPIPRCLSHAHPQRATSSSLYPVVPTVHVPSPASG